MTDDRLLFERALMLGDFGPRLEHELTFPETRCYVDTGYGLKYRMHPVSAVMLDQELDKLANYILQREDKLSYFSRGIEGLPGLKPPKTRKYCTHGGYYGYRPFFNSGELNGLSIDIFIKIMTAEGMEIRRSNNAPLHTLYLFKELWPEVNKINLPNSHVFFNSTISLPTFTLEAYNFIDEYIRAFEKVCVYFSRNSTIDVESFFS